MMMLKEDKYDWSFCVKNDKTVWEKKIKELISYNEEIESAIYERMSLYLYLCEDFIGKKIPIIKNLATAKTMKNRIRILKEEIGFTLHYGDPTNSNPNTNLNEFQRKNNSKYVSYDVYRIWLGKVATSPDSITKIINKESKINEKKDLMLLINSWEKKIEQFDLAERRLDGIYQELNKCFDEVELNFNKKLKELSFKIQEMDNIQFYNGVYGQLLNM
jgi:hypothetical protein